MQEALAYIADHLPPDADEIPPELVAIAQKCNDDFDKRGKLNVQIGGAGIFFSPTGKTNDLTAQGIYGSGVVRYTLPGQDLSLVGAVAYRTNEAVPDPATKGAFLSRDRLSVGGRLVFGSANTWMLGVEAAYQRADYSGSAGGRDDYATYVAAVDVKVGDDLWVNFKAGGSSGHRRDGNPAFFGTSLTWGAKPTIQSR